MAAHFARQQKALCRCICKVGSNAAWREAARKIRGSCGAFVLWRHSECAGSRFLAPVVYEISRDNENAPILFFEVNVDAFPEARSYYNIELTPAFTTFHHGELVSKTHGISQNSLHELFQELCNRIDCCCQCGRQDRLRFMSRVEDAIASGVCPGVPSGKCSFDIDPFATPNESECIETRMVYLLGKLDPCSDGEPPESTTLLLLQLHFKNQPELIGDFLAACTDEGPHVGSFVEITQEWLGQQYHCHPSLWERELFKVRDRIVRMALCRRAARAELWFLQNLTASRSGSKACEAHDRELWLQFRSRLEKLQENTVCPRQCAQCLLPCSLLRRHAGRCDCTTDHQCHCMSSHGQCEGRAGHQDLHHFPAPPLPQSPPPSPPSALPALVSPTSSNAPLTRSAAAVACVKLPTMTVDELRNSWTGTRRDSHSDCAICFEPLGTSVEELYCKHVFHSRCISWWVTQKKICPLCRSPVDNVTCTRVQRSAELRARQPLQATQSSAAVAAPVSAAMQLNQGSSASARAENNGRSSSVPGRRREIVSSIARARPSRGNASNPQTPSHGSQPRTPTSRRQHGIGQPASAP